MAPLAYTHPSSGLALVVDMDGGTGGWRLEGRPVTAEEALRRAPPGDVVRIARGAVADVRGHALAAGPPRSEALRLLAARLWGDHRDALSARADQQQLPGV